MAARVFFEIQFNSGDVDSKMKKEENNKICLILSC